MMSELEDLTMHHLKISFLCSCIKINAITDEIKNIETAILNSNEYAIVTPSNASGQVYHQNKIIPPYNKATKRRNKSNTYPCN